MFTTPIVYLYFDRAQQKLAKKTRGCESIARRAGFAVRPGYGARFAVRQVTDGAGRGTALLRGCGGLAARMPARSPTQSAEPSVVEKEVHPRLPFRRCGPEPAGVPTSFSTGSKRRNGKHEPRHKA